MDCALVLKVIPLILVIIRSVKLLSKSIPVNYRLQTKLLESDVFRPVCHSLHGGGGLPNRDTLDRDTPGQRHPWTETPLYSKEWSVRILLECILVPNLNW